MNALNTKQNIKGKIPCLVIVFFNTEITKKTLNFLTKYNDILDITVIENYSPNTEFEIKPYLINLLMNDRISRYILFEKNIAMNTLKTIFNNNIIDLSTPEYIMITDGDLIVVEGDWLNEEINILRNNTDIFACGINLSLDNLPLKTCPGADKWFPPAKMEYTDYYEGLTGTTLLLMRTSYFKDYLAFAIEKDLECIDTHMHYYCYRFAHKKWARTKLNKAIHLTWDEYNNPDSLYTKFKHSKPVNDIWYHKDYCPFEVYTKFDYMKFDK